MRLLIRFLSSCSRVERVQVFLFWSTLQLKWQYFFSLFLPKINLQLDLQLQDETGGDISSFVTNGEWDLLGKFFALHFLWKFPSNYNLHYKSIIRHISINHSNRFVFIIIFLFLNLLVLFAIKKETEKVIFFGNEK